MEVGSNDGGEGIHFIMRSCQTTTIFTQQQDFSQGSSSFVVSILVHGAVFVLVLSGIASNPKMNDRVMAQQYTVRHLDLHTTKTEAQLRASSKIAYPGPHLDNSASEQKNEAKSAHVPAVLAASRQISHTKLGPQTLVQPMLSSQLTLTEALPIPTVMIWTPEKAPAKTIVAPRPQEITAATVEPSLDAPNEEVKLSDRSVSATGLLPQAASIQPSTTSPLVVHGDDKAQRVPATASEDTAQPTPTAVLSLSDLRMKEGSVTLPPVNETASSSAPAGTSDRSGSHSLPKDHLSNKAEKIGTGDGNQKLDSVGTAHISLPKDGQFGAVIVGSALRKIYPEVAELWGDRVAYTVYLHVGLSKSWTLQYAVPRAVDAAAAGSSARLEAPWPYSIVRPNLDRSTIDAEALMVHGYVSLEGRLENLTVVFPPEFAQTQFLLTSLAQWQFRPAAQNGNPVRVEVLLVIPEEPE
jgi:hypothetical protein